MKKLFKILALLSVLAISAPAAALTCYQYGPAGTCLQWGPTPPANTRYGQGTDPILANGEVAAFTSTNGHGAGAYWVVFHAPLYYGALGDWDGAYHINSVKCGPQANAIFYSDSTFSTAVGSCSPGQTVQNTGPWSVSSLHAF